MSKRQKSGSKQKGTKEVGIQVSKKHRGKQSKCKSDGGNHCAVIDRDGKNSVKWSMREKKVAINQQAAGAISDQQ